MTTPITPLPPLPISRLEPGLYEDFDMEDYGRACADAAVLADRAARKPLTEDELLHVILSIRGIDHAKTHLTYYSGAYEIVRPTFGAEALCRAIERAHGIVSPADTRPADVSQNSAKTNTREAG
jgi:hypothetical protein